MGKELYKEKPEDYYNLIRREIIDLIPEGTKNILDIGCGEGATAQDVKRRLGPEFVAGVELSEEAYQIAKKKLDSVVLGNIEEINLPFVENFFDCIICADVLEHLVNPWEVLIKLKKYLSSDGCLIASIPNLQYIGAILKIVFNKYDYEVYGIFDKSHLRFFTLHTIKKMFNDCGYEIIKIEDNRNNSMKMRILNIVSFGLFKPFSIFQYLIVARKSN